MLVDLRIVFQVAFLGAASKRRQSRCDTLHSQKYIMNGAWEPHFDVAG